MFRYLDVFVCILVSCVIVGRGVACHGEGLYEITISQSLYKQD